jgi:hypothetical protein
MATSQILGLFTSPEQYQANQMAQFRQQAANEVQLNPFQQAAIGMRQAGYQLGGGIGGAMGGQDPQLQKIARRQALAGQLDPSNPQSYMQVAKMAADAGDQEFAIAIADAGRSAMSEMALVQQRLREKQGAEPFEQLVRTGKYTPASLSVYKTSGNVADLELIEKPIKERNIAFGTEAERKSKTMYGKAYADLTPEEAGKVDQAVEASEQAKAKAGAMILPGQPVEPKDWLKFSEYISKDPVMDRTSTIISDAPTAIETIRSSTQNSFSAASLPAAIAKLTGEGKNMSNQDIARYARTGGLTDRLSQDVVGFFTGKKTDVTKQQAEQFAVALYRGALIERKKFIEDQAAQLGYDKSPNYQTSIQQLDKKLSQFKLVNPQGGKTPTPTETKPFDADKERRYQEWKAKQTGATR